MSIDFCHGMPEQEIREEIVLLRRIVGQVDEELRFRNFQNGQRDMVLKEIGHQTMIQLAYLELKLEAKKQP